MICEECGNFTFIKRLCKSCAKVRTERLVDEALESKLREDG